MEVFLFDLDGTLLPMDNDLFIEIYFKGVVTKLYPYGIDSKNFLDTIKEGIMAMIKNDGSMTNEDRFWDTVISLHGNKARDLEPVFIDYYRNEFQEARKSTKTNPLAKDCISLLKSKGYRIILATNPLFPSVATYNRIKWAGLEPEDFELITTFDNSSYCKPNIRYYEEIIAKQELQADKCIMVGNNVNEDMIVETVGLDTFLLTDCLINPDNKDISQYKNGSIDELYQFIKNLPIIS
ncbi:MAG: HAD family hydrolase [Clostridiales bacterium]|nr:HAD family hydrolase [Clostridiales bacterium]